MVAPLWLSGCNEGKDPRTAAIRKASITIENLSGAGQSMAAGVEFRQKQFRSVLTEVKPCLDSPLGGQVSAANMLIAQADGGLADIDAAAASELETASIRQISLVRGSLETWCRQSAVARAADAYDPAAELKDLDQRRSEIEKQLAEATAQRRTAADEAAALDKRAEDLLAQAKSKRGAAAQARMAASSVSAVEALKIIEKASKITREADELDRQATNLKSQVAIAQPVLSQMQQRIDGLAGAKTVFDVSRKTIADRAALMKVQAADARAVAQTAGEAAARQAEELKKFRSGDLVAKTDSAVKQYRDAAAAAKKAMSGADPKDAGTIKSSIGVYQQAAGDVLFGKARGIQAYHDVMVQLAEASPPLQSAAAYKAGAEELSKQLETAVSEAREAYKEAKSSLEGVSNPVAAKERLERSIALMESIETGKIEAPAAAVAAKPAADKAAPASAGTSPATSAIEATVRPLMERALGQMKAGDIDGLLASTHFRNDAEREAAAGLKAMIGASRKLNEACKSKFGKTLDETLDAGAGPGMGGAAKGFKPLLNAADGLFGKYKETNPEDYVFVSSSPTTASFNLKSDEETSFDFMQVDGKWMNVLGKNTEKDQKSMGEMSKALVPVSEVLSGLADDVNGGKVPTPQALFMGLMTKLMPVLQKVMPGMGGPGGPGGG